MNLNKERYQNSVPLRECMAGLGSGEPTKL